MPRVRSLAPSTHLRFDTDVGLLPVALQTVMARRLHLTTALDCVLRTVCIVTTTQTRLG